MDGPYALLVEKLDIQLTGYLASDAQMLIKATLADLAERYGGEGDETPIEAAEFEPPHGAFFVAYLDGEPVGCGGWRSYGEDGTAAEIKRLYTAPATRGRGIARATLGAIEESAKESGRPGIVLVTGDRQPEAIKLYESAGYRRIPNFGFYRDYEDCICFGRDV